MKEALETIHSDAVREIASAGDIESLEKLKLKYLGKKGSLTEILKGLSALPIEERKFIGEKANSLRGKIEKLAQEKLTSLTREKLSRKISEERVDITLPPYPYRSGRLHPLKETISEISSIFKTLGFSVAEGPEIETDYYNFEALNIPKDHPARDSQDTFYLGNGKLLRTHTSPVQVHVMENTRPPVKVIVPGRVYRNEATDATHSAIFHQIEGLYVDENVTFGELKGSLEFFIKRFFGPSVNLRFRPSHFQFTEPSAEVDIACIICKGAGCRVCKNSGWLEVLGCGMVHPNVFRHVKYDTNTFTGFAFGIGVERFAMLKYRVDDMRLFYENNLDFLEQFINPSL